MPETPKSLIPLWRLDGTLTTLGPLRIGDGSVLEKRIPRCKKERDSDKESPVEVAGVFVDSASRAFLPGSSLKGFLRSYLEQIASEDLIYAAFGYQLATSESENRRGEGLGGAVTVWDARIPESAALPDAVEDPYWSKSRATCVGSHVVLDRRTRTASDELLFYQEYVPAKIGFDLSLLVEGGELKGLAIDDIAGALLAALEGLGSSTARLGASNAEGWGHLKWQLKAARQFGDAAIASWLNHPGTPLVEYLTPVNSAPLLARGRQLLHAGSAATVDFQIDLHFVSPFLVNDASRVKQEGERDTDKPNHTPLKSPDGGPLLPASSLHGALRAQAERIARTLGHSVCKPDGKGNEKLPAIQSDQDLGKLDLVSKLFGAPGWRSAVRLSDFTLATGSANPGVPRRQEFVAIDRFTGGGADQLKFNAEGFAPSGREGFTLRGVLSLDVRRLKELLRHTGGKWDEFLYLLAYTLRDLCEGDIPAGFGRSKGYGACTAKVTLLSEIAGNASLPEDAGRLIQDCFGERKIA